MSSIGRLPGRAFGCAVILAVHLVFPKAIAQQLDEIVVTAQMREQDLHEIPVAVTAVSRERLEQNEISNVEDLSRLVPSLRYTADHNNQRAVNIRGIGTNVYSVAVEPNVAVMLDDVVLARTDLANFEFADIERVEVLRGPQGTLFGKNASAGLVHVITRAPSHEFEARGRVSYEKPQHFPGDLLRAQATVNVPISRDLAARFNVFTRRFNGHLEDVEQGGNAPDSDEYGLRGTLQWEPAEALTMRLNLEYQRREGESGLITYRDGSPTRREKTGFEFGKANRKGRSTGGNASDLEGAAASLKVDWRVREHILSSITGYRDATVFDNITVAALDGTRGHLTRNANEVELETFTQELRLISDGDGALEYTFGALWFQNRAGEDFERQIEDLSAEIIAHSSGIGFLPPGFADDLGGHDALDQYDTRDVRVDTRNLGIYAQGTWHVSDRWRLIAGARYIDEEVDVKLATTSRLSQSSTDAEISSSEFPSSGATVSDTTATGMLALMYAWRPNVNLYGSVSTGYRGTAFDVATDDPQHALDNPIRPEKATSYELGMRSRWFDNRMELSLTAFLAYFEDFQAQVRDLDRPGTDIVAHRLDNAGELETRGVELEWQARPTAALSLMGSLLYNRAVYNEFVTQCFAGQGPNEGGAIDENGDGSCDANDVSGGVLANAPQLSASISARYERDFAAGHAAYGQISGRWQDEVQFTNEQQPTTIEGSYSLWDLRLGWQGPEQRWEVAGYVKNLFAKNHAVNLIPLSVHNDRRDVVHRQTMEADRIFGLSLSYRL